MGFPIHCLKEILVWGHFAETSGAQPVSVALLHQKYHWKEVLYTSVFFPIFFFIFAILGMPHTTAHKIQALQKAQILFQPCDDKE